MLAAMDASVLAAIAKWPNVPDVYGWLALTARGQWRLCGEPIANAAIRDFIGRNYASDRRGRWYFQNGPQRVYVALELAPWVFRVQPNGHLYTFVRSAPRRLLGAALVDGEHFVLLTELGAGNVDDRDCGCLLEALVDERGRRLDDAAVERVLFDGEHALVRAAAVGLIGPSLPLQRLSPAALEAAFDFQRAPAPD
jgi:hypothetical protein